MIKKMHFLHDIQEWEALKEEAQGSQGIMIFKLSPICGISTMAERAFDAWYERLPEEANVVCAKVDVIGARPLSQHIAKELGVEHQSPQALWVTPGNKVQWHASHYSLTSDRLSSAIGVP